MSIQLFLRLDGLNYYGNIPEPPEKAKGVIEEYPLSFEDTKLLLADIDSIDAKCNALLDFGDVDFFNSEKCGKLQEWIEDRLQKPTVPRYREILEVLKRYCIRAIELNTGLVIEL